MSGHLWYQVQEHEGEIFRRDGTRFRYSIGADSLSVVNVGSASALDIPIAHFDKAVARWPVEDVGALNDVAGGSYIHAILSDTRISRDEERIIHAFCTWLTEQGWTYEREVEFVDVVAERDGVRLFVEAKGKNNGPARRGIDTLYGQLLRRMTHGRAETVRYAAVVPDNCMDAVLEVPKEVLELLRIAVYIVDDNGAVTAVSE
jgi:hypothetical protein